MVFFQRIFDGIFKACRIVLIIYAYAIIDIADRYRSVGGGTENAVVGAFFGYSVSQCIRRSQLAYEKRSCRFITGRSRRRRPPYIARRLVFYADIAGSVVRKHDVGIVFSTFPKRPDNLTPILRKPCKTFIVGCTIDLKSLFAAFTWNASDIFGNDLTSVSVHQFKSFSVVRTIKIWVVN